MRDLREQLEGAVGTKYRIGKELTGGGMSRVFIADDLALGRQVVIKVLHPDLAAGVNAERFDREVQLAARLQHPHIVPVLTAGEVDGLPYYVMPFVKGESLAARVERGPLPVAEVIHIMGDVARALAYAQSEHIVHRDIKPQNILVSGGAACVADFGIAKALSSSKRHESEGLTSVGTSLGTAEYMAPEQVAGDASLDHRADIYALGCVAYELLTGSSPFAGKPPQQMLAAHVLEEPASPQAKRADVPPALADLVLRCLAKDPSQRPQSGDEILAALDGITGITGITLGTTGSQPRIASKRTTLVAVVGIAAAAAIVAGIVLARGRGEKTSAGVTLAIAPFDVLDPQLSLWKEGLVDVLSRNLDGAADMHTVSPSASIRKWEGRVGREDAAAFAKRVGAQIVVYGSLQPAGQGIVDAKTWILDARGTSAPIELSARDSSARMDRLSDSLSVKLLSAIGGKRTATSVRSLGSGSLPAIKAFLTGAQYFRRTRFDSAGAAFRDAIGLDSTFAIAHAFLNQTLGWTQGSTEERVHEAALARRSLRAGLSPLDSLMITAVAQYWDTTGLGDENRRASYATLGQATERYPTDALMWYLLGDLRFHRDPHFSDAEALHDFNRSIDADSDFVPSYIHAVEISSRWGYDAAMRYAKPYFARSSGDHDSRSKQLALALAAPGGARDAKRWAVVDTAPLSDVTTAAGSILRMPDSAETAVRLLRAELKRPEANAPNESGIRATFISVLGARGHVKEAWDLALSAKDFTASELALLGLVPADSAARALKTWGIASAEHAVALAPALALTHDTAALIGDIAELTKRASALGPNVPALQRYIAPYSIASLHAYYQLARGDSASAQKEFDALSDSLINVPTDQFIRVRLIERSDPKRALELLESKRLTGDILSVARELEIGRLAERANDVPRAVDAYAYVAGSWQNSDSEQLKSAVRESRDALKRLDADGRVRAQISSPR